MPYKVRCQECGVEREIKDLISDFHFCKGMKSGPLDPMPQQLVLEIPHD